MTYYLWLLQNALCLGVNKFSTNSCMSEMMYNIWEELEEDQPGFRGGLAFYEKYS